MIAYRAMVDVPRELVLYVSGSPHAERRRRRARKKTRAFVILGGEVIDTDRVCVKTISRKGETIDLWYSGKTHDFGGNVQAVIRPDAYRSGSRSLSMSTSTAPIWNSTSH